MTSEDVGMTDSTDPRCLASCEVAPDVLKRCIRAAGHVEDHTWIEALNVVGTDPTAVFWRGVEKHPHTRARLVRDTW